MTQPDPSLPHPSLPPLPQALVASARRFDLKSRDEIALIGKYRADWQASAWAYYDTNPYIRFSVRYAGNMLSRLQLFPAWRPDPAADPIPLDPENEEIIEAGMQDLAFAARAEVDRMAGPTGDHGQLVGPLAMNLDVAGEAWVVAVPDPEILGGERWEVFSTSELKVETDRVLILRDDGDREGEPVPDGAVFLRIWNAHPRWRNRPDSAIRALLDPLEELALLERGIRAGATSRLNAGVFLVPSELEILQAAAEQSAGQDTSGDPQQSKLLQAIVAAMTEPVLNPGSATQLVPLILKGPKELLDAVRHLTLSRPFDAEQQQQRDELRKVIGAGVDLPSEIVLGLGEANHWTAWAISEEAYKAHLDPKALMILDGLTRKVLHPGLIFAGFLPKDVIIWRDPSDLIADPDLWKRAQEAHGALVISDAALRRYGRFSEEDAPDEAEQQARAERARPQAPGASSGPPGNREDVEEAPPEQEAATVTPITAALKRARRSDLTRLSRRLAAIDKGCRDAITSRADHAIARAVDVAGSRVRRHLQGEPAKSLSPKARSKRLQLREAVRHIPNDRVCADLAENPLASRALIVSLGLEEEDLIDAQLGDLAGGATPTAGTVAATFLDRTTRAYSEARRAALGELEPVGEFDLDVADDRQRKHIEEGFAVLAGAIVTTIRDRLFAPVPLAPAQGEVPDLTTARIPAGAVRDAIAVAGGAPSAAPDPSTGRPSGGIATGEETGGFLEEMFGVTANGGRWVYGDPGSRTRPFDAHEALDGVDFAGWDDPVLTNGDSWPPFPFYFPGDHDYCQCDYIPALELGEPIAGAAEGDQPDEEA